MWLSCEGEIPRRMDVSQGSQPLGLSLDSLGSKRKHPLCWVNGPVSSNQMLGPIPGKEWAHSGRPRPAGN